MRVVGAAWIRDGRVLAAQRGPGRSSAGLWEFPGGKVEPGEDDAAALRRELSEELGVRASVGARVGAPVRTDAIELVVYVVGSDDAPTATEHTALRWLSADELRSVPWVEADVAFLDPLEAVLRP